MLLPLCDSTITKVEEQKSYCTHEICKLNSCMYGQNNLETKKQTLFFHSNEQNGNQEWNLPIQLFSPGGVTLFGFTFTRGRNTIIYHNCKKCQGSLFLSLQHLDTLGTHRKQEGKKQPGGNCTLQSIICSKLQKNVRKQEGNRLQC